MTAPRPALVLALAGLRAEGDLVRALTGWQAPATIARRVTDVVGLLAACRAGLADGVLVAPGFAGLDATVVQAIRDTGVPCWGVVERHDDQGHSRLRDLGLAAGVLGDGDPASVIRSLLAGPRPAGHVTGAVGGPLVVVTGPAGAPGRSTVAVNLAAECAPALLVDADVVAPSVAFQLDLDGSAAGILGMCRAAQQGSLTPETLQAMAHVTGTGLRVVAGVPAPERAAELRPAGYEALWQTAARCDVPVVVDAGPLPAHPAQEDAGAAALGAATVVVVVAQPTALGIRRLVSGLPEVAARTSAPLTIVWNGLRPRRQAGGLGRRPLERLHAVTASLRVGVDVAGLPWDPGAAAAVDARPGSLADAAPRSPLRAAIRRLAAHVLAEAPRSPVPSERPAKPPRSRQEQGPSVYG